MTGPEHVDTQPYRRPRPRICRATYPVRTDSLYRLECVHEPGEHPIGHTLDGRTGIVHQTSGGQYFFLKEELQ